jgi:DNA helicase HerA-like ATPase
LGQWLVVGFSVFPVVEVLVEIEVVDGEDHDSVEALGDGDGDWEGGFLVLGFGVYFLAFLCL